MVFAGGGVERDVAGDIGDSAYSVRCGRRVVVSQKATQTALRGRWRGRWRVQRLPAGREMQ